MPPFFRGPTPFAHRYRDLVRMAYLVLSAELDEHGRMLLAHQMVSRSLPRRAPAPRDADAVYRAVRARVLAEALDAPHRLPMWQTVWGSWLRAAPVRAVSEELALAAAIAAMPPESRAAYVLANVAGLAADEVRTELARAGVADPDTAIRGADGGRLGLDAETQRTLLSRPALDPTIVRLYGRPPRVTRPMVLGAAAVALVLVAGVIGAAVLYGRSPGAGPAAAALHPAAADGLTTVGGDVWRDSTRLDLSVWPARGDLAGDRTFTKAALDAWNGGHPVAHDGVDGGPPPRDPHLLYAGRVGAARVALMLDDDRVARYTRTGGRTAIEVFSDAHPLPGAAGPLKLTESGGAARYLLPPWVPSLRAATTGTDRAHDKAAWAPVPVRDGVTGPVPVASAAPGGCWRGPVLDLAQPTIAHGRSYTMADLGGLTPARMTYQPPPPAPIRRLGPHQIDGDHEGSPQGFGIWGRLGCVGPAPYGRSRASTVEAASAWEFWSGKLPAGGGRGHWVCARYTFADGHSAVRVALLGGDGGTRWAVPTGAARDTWDCSRLKRDLVTGTWWRAPSGKWYYLGAGSRRIVVFTAHGPFPTPKVSHDFLVAPGPTGGARPAGRVTLGGRNYHDQAVSAFQAP
ncbi:MAG TPA: hypothetical protein VGL93_35075 [Streptosporangiaceae bacterium]|jgi:hypothetical protein